MTLHRDRLRVRNDDLIDPRQGCAGRPMGRRATHLVRDVHPNGEVTVGNRTSSQTLQVDRVMTGSTNSWLVELGH